jgi:hypothetical protein
MIDYKHYVNLDTEDLEKLVAHAKNIINLRVQDEVAAVTACDSQALLKTFEQNERRLLSDKAWEALDIDMIPFDKLDFFQLMRTLPQYKKKSEQYLKDNYHTYEEKLAGKSIKDVQYLSYCLDNEEYQPFVMKLIESGEFTSYLKPDDTIIVDTLVQKGLVKPGHDVLEQINQWLQNRTYNTHHFTGYLEYVLSQHDVKLPAQDAQEFFKKNWNQCSYPLKKMLLEQGGDVKMNLDEAMQTYTISLSTANEMANYKDLVKASTERFAETIGMFELTSNAVSKMMQNLRNILNNKGNDSNGEIRYNMAQLFTYVHHHLPEAQHIIEEYATDNKYPRFKQLASRMMLYVQLDQDIPVNEVDDEDVNLPRGPKI